MPDSLPDRQAGITPLQIGDTIPEWLWHHPLQVVNHPEGKDTITLSDYRGKLIILDFWATWCGSCIAAMPNVHRVATKFADRVALIPVTREGADLVSSFLSTNKTTMALGLPSVVADQRLSTLFEHKTVPHYSWIGTSGTVLAATASHQIDETNISNVLSGQPGALIQKKPIDPMRPLLLEDDLSLAEVRQYSLLLKGQHRGLFARNIQRSEDGVIYGRAAVNLSLLHIYRMVAGRMVRGMGQPFTSGHLLVESSKPEGLFYNESHVTIPKAEWHKKNLHTLDVMLPLRSAHLLDSVILNTLNNSSGYHGSVERRTIPCYVIRRLGVPDVPIAGDQPPDNPIIKNGLTGLQTALGRLATDPLPIVDETGPTDDIPHDVSGISDLPSIREVLGEHGMELIEAPRNVTVFVIRDRQSLTDFVSLNTPTLESR